MTPIVKAVQSVRSSVVNIRGEKLVATETAVATANTEQRRVNGMGTGVVIDDRGYIITNYHVVENVRDIRVTLASGKSFTANLVARDSETDLAIIKIKKTDELKVITMGDSDDLLTGEPVIAVGNAYGYEHTVTQGIVSALHRAVQVSDAQYYADLIQTDASINPGNSGGPLLNIDGEMIGINVAVRAGAQGIGFAIPTAKVTEVISRLLASHNADSFSHGLALKTNKRKHVIVRSVSQGSPADEAGLKDGDRLVRIDNVRLHNELDFQKKLLDSQPGDIVKVWIDRDGERVDAELTLGPTFHRKPQNSQAWNVLGLSLSPLSQKEFQRRFRTSRYRGGLEVVDLRPGGPAAQRGIQRGDVLVGMHVWETVTMDNLSYILNRADLSKNDPIKFYILRGNEALYGKMSITANNRTARRP
jgi:serine protease Do